jgi:hypothetical protein
MERENVEKLGKLYRRAKAASDTPTIGLLEKAMDHLVVAESAITSMMVAESLAIETLRDVK